jgi:chromosome segregation ATPase
MAQPRSKFDEWQASAGPRAATATAAEPQDIETLKERYEKLRERKTIAETDLKNAQKRLNELKKLARDEYQTDVLEELEAKLENMKAENKKRRAEYETSLNSIEQSLRDVEQQYADNQVREESQ